MKPEYRCTAWVTWDPKEDHVHQCDEQKFHHGNHVCKCGYVWQFDQEVGLKT